jgi:hypothetical protein
LFLKPLKKMDFLAGGGGARAASKEMRGHKSYVMRFLADFVLDTPEKHLGLLSVLGGQRSALKGMPGHKSYAMRFLADFAPETLEKSGRKSLIQALMRFLTDSVLETFEKHGFAGPAGKRAKASTERGCRDTTPIS